MTVYGNEVPESPYNARRSVIGEIEKTGRGNIVFRVGAMWADHPERGWQQTEHVVLTPYEAKRLMSEIIDNMPSKLDPDRETVLFRFSRETAALILSRLNGDAPSDDERYVRFHERMADFVFANEQT